MHKLLFASVTLACLSVLTACGPAPSSTNPSSSPSPGASSPASPAPGASAGASAGVSVGGTVSPSSSPTSTPSLVPATELVIEAETASKILGAGRYPQDERRGNRGIIVKTFSGTDANSSATLQLPVLKGKYQVKANYYNHDDSPELVIELGGVSLKLPAGSTSSTNGDLKIYDFGTQLLNIEAGGILRMTVGGNKTGGAGAWIGVDSFTFTPVP